MKKTRMTAGAVALAGFAVALNVLVLKENLFVPQAIIPLAVAIAAGVIYLVIVLAQTAGQRRGKTASGLHSVFASLIFLCICIVIYAFARHWDVSWDLTREGRRELAPQTVQVLENLSKEVEVVCFFITTGDSDVEVARDKTRRFLERCQRHSSYLQVEFVDPQQHPERLEALGVKRLSAQGSIVLKCGARQKEIPLSDVTARLEERDFTNALINVVRNAEPKICFLTGHGERRIIDTDLKEGGSQFRLWIEKEAYKPEEIAIPLTKPSVPADCDVLVINSPQQDLHPSEIEAIQEYLDRGGRLLMLLDAWRLPESELPIAEQMRPWLRQRYGIVVGSDLIVSEESKGQAPLIPDFGLPVEGDPNEQILGSFNKEHPITRGFDQNMVFVIARSVGLADKTPKGVEGVELLYTMPGTWAETDLDMLFEKQLARKDPDETDGPISVAVAVTESAEEAAATGGNREARIMVVGNAAFAKNETMRVLGHINFLMNTLAWLTENEELMAIRPTGEEDPPLLLSKGQEQAVAWIAILGTVQAVAGAGVLAFLLRRKHQ